MPTTRSPEETVSSINHQASPRPGDIQSPRLIWIKGVLFACLGVLAAVILVFRQTSWVDAALLAITVWACCRAYYFAFYVIEHYVDSRYRYDGVTSFIMYAIRKRKQRSTDA